MSPTPITKSVTLAVSVNASSLTPQEIRTRTLEFVKELTRKHSSKGAEAGVEIAGHSGVCRHDLCGMGDHVCEDESPTRTPAFPSEHPEMRDELAETINRHCAENGSDTPDFILAEYLTGCLAVFDRTLRKREQWYGRGMKMQDAETPDPAPTETPAWPEDDLVSTYDTEHKMWRVVDESDARLRDCYKCGAPTRWQICGSYAGKDGKKLPLDVSAEKVIDGQLYAPLHVTHCGKRDPSSTEPPAEGPE